MSTEGLARAVAGVRPGSVPVDARRAARAAIRDGIGVALAGAGEDGPRRLRQVVAAHGGGADVAGVWGTDVRASAPDAALLNGAAAHVLDLDDLNRSLRGHPTVALLPALFALCEARGLSGQALVESYVIGFEVECKLGALMNLEHFERGWHSTSTLGALGAAAGCGWLLGLDAARMTSAIALAASMASGLNANFGSMAKAFHAGHAARSGLFAALLAETGFTGHPQALEAKDGFVEIFSGRPGAALADVVESFGRPWDVVDPGIAFKLYPACSLTHPPLDAALDLVAAHGIRAEAIERITCDSDYRVPMVLTHRRPRSGLEGKFSLEYALAVAFCDGQAGIEQFEDARVARPDVQALLQKVEFRVHPDLATRESLEQGFAIVAVDLVGGGRHERRVGPPRGTPENPLTDAALAEKFRACAGRALPPDRVASVLRRIDRLESEPSVTALATDLRTG